MVYAVYILAAAAVGLLIGFVVLSIALLRKTVSSNIRSKTISLMSVYDDLLDQKSRELSRLAADNNRSTEDSSVDGKIHVPQHISSCQPAAPQLGAAEIMNMAECSGGVLYRDEAMGGMYQKIRRNFSFLLDELLPAFSSAPKNLTGPAGHLLSELDYDTVYRLSTLPGKYQEMVLREVLTEDEVPLLCAYMENNKEFNVLEFYYCLRTIADSEPKAARLRVPAGMVSGMMTGDGVEIIPDEGICEGFQLEEGNLLYDYCIKTRELS